MAISRTRGEDKDIRETWAEREKARAERGRPGMFQGTDFVTGAQLDAQDEQRRKKELLEMQNKGTLAQEEERNKGALSLADRRQSALSERAKLEREQESRQFQAGLDLKKRQMQMDQNKALLDRFNTLTTSDVDPLTGEVLREGIPREKAFEQLKGERALIEELTQKNGNQQTDGMNRSADIVRQTGQNSWSNVGGGGASSSAMQNQPIQRNKISNFSMFDSRDKSRSGTPIYDRMRGSESKERFNWLDYPTIPFL